MNQTITTEDGIERCVFCHVSPEKHQDWCKNSGKGEYQCVPCLSLYNLIGQKGFSGKFISGAKRIRCPECKSGKVREVKQ